MDSAMAGEMVMTRKGVYLHDSYYNNNYTIVYMWEANALGESGFDGRMWGEGGTPNFGGGNNGNEENENKDSLKYIFIHDSDPYEF